MTKKYLAAVLMALASTASSAATYGFVAPAYSGFTDFTAPCATPVCTNFSPGMRVQGSFTTAANLPPGLVSANIVGLVTDYSLSDGLTTYSSSDPQSRLMLIGISTDAAGNPVDMEFAAERWRTPGVHAANDRLDMAWVWTGGGGFSRGWNNRSCSTVGVAPTGTADACLVLADDASTSMGDAAASAPPVLLAAPVVAAVPTLSQWAVLALALAMSGSGLWMARRR